MSLTDDLADMLKDIIEDNLKAFQRCDKTTRLLNMIMKTNKKSCELVRRKRIDGF